MNWRMLSVIPPIVFGVLVFMWMTGEGDNTEAAETPEAALAVRVQQIAPQTFVAAASGFGRVQASETWQAISQVTGRAVQVNAAVAEGEVVHAGDLLVEIDPRDYEIALTKAQTAVASARTAIQELEASTANTTATLKLEQEIEAFYQTELTRQQSLAKRGTVSQTALDQAQRALLTQKKVALGLQNTLALAPVKRKTLEATLAARLAEQEEATRALSNTKITAPFDGRIAAANVTLQEFVRSGDIMLEIDNVISSEVTAEFQPSVVSNLFRGASVGIRAQGLNLTDLNIAAEVLDRMNLTAEVEVTAGENTYIWPAKLIRVNIATDSQTGTIGLVVRVNNPTRPDPIAMRPPLANGSFVRVTLTAPEKADKILITRDVLRHAEDGSRYVYVMNADQRLARRTVSVGSISGNLVVVTEGLKVGDNLVLSDPQPAIQGMLLDAVIEQQVAK